MNELIITLSSIAGVILSLLFQYIPGLSDWYEAQTSQLKAGVMLACLVVATVVLYSASCNDFISVIACDEQGLKTLALAFVMALAGNQSTHQIAKHL